MFLSHKPPIFQDPPPSPGSNSWRLQTLGETSRIRRLPSALVVQNYRLLYEFKDRSLRQRCPKRFERLHEESFVGWEGWHVRKLAPSTKQIKASAYDSDSDSDSSMATAIDILFSS